MEAEASAEAKEPPKALVPAEPGSAGGEAEGAAPDRPAADAGAAKAASSPSSSSKPAKPAKKAAAEPVEVKPATASREDNLQYDLKHMAAYDISPLSTKVDFMAYTRDSVQLLVNKMFTLNKVRIEEGMALELPKEEVFRLPRQRPVPKDKPKTRFQKFMEEKNMQKRKRSRLVFDDVSQDWVPRWGYGSVKKNQEKAQWLHEVKEGEDPYADPFERKAVEQKLVAAKQKMREVRNKVEAAGGKLRASVADLKDGKVNSGRGKDALREAIKRAQTASGSRGKFDRTAPNEATNLQPKKKHKGVTKSLGEEKAAYLKTATRLLSGGVDKDKAAKVGASGGATQVPRGKKGKSNLAARRSKNGGRMHHKK